MAGYRILIVDDDEGTLTLLGTKLTEQGYEVFKARKGQEAVDQARSHQPHLILMDIMLPDFEGSEAVRILSGDPLTRNIEVVFISSIVARDEEQDTQSVVKVGNHQYKAMSKPFYVEDVLAIVREAQDRQGLS